MHLFVRRDPRLQHGQSDDDRHTSITSIGPVLLFPDLATLLVLGAYIAFTPLPSLSYVLRDTSDTFEDVFA